MHNLENYDKEAISNINKSFACFNFIADSNISTKQFILLCHQNKIQLCLLYYNHSTTISQSLLAITIFINKSHLQKNWIINTSSKIIQFFTSKFWVIIQPRKANSLKCFSKDVFILLWNCKSKRSLTKALI